jgi:prepilin-type N-terminal cleavage/methylation domain-containing protein
MEQLTMILRPRTRPRPGKQPDRPVKGFSLLETLVAMGILAVGVLAMASAMVTALKYSRQSRALTQATYLAEQQIEAFASMTSADVEAMLGDASYPNDPLNPIDPDPNDGDAISFNRRWTIQPNTPEAGTLSLSVQVDWVDPRGGVRTVQLQTVKGGL